MIIGIDLGTTNSLVSVWQNGKAILVPNALGEVLTPSAVCVGDDGMVLVGRAARDRWLTQPHTGAVAFKRYMGTNRVMRLKNTAYRPDELSALVLKSLKADAERFLGEPVTEAVITVPAYFSDAQRTATRQAGELASLAVRRLVNEPTAAALAYGLQEAESESTFLVLDLGGGTFDVAILERFEGLMQVRASTGDNFLGGEDFVEVLIQMARKALPDLPSDDAAPALHARLWREAERVKRTFSTAQTEEFALEWEGKSYRHALRAEEFEAACEPLLQRFRRPIERALRDAKLTASSLDQVVLAGGATRMPMIRKMVSKMFGRMPAMNLNPDEVIARGAAVMAGLVAKDQTLQEVVMVDVCPYSLGTGVGRIVEGVRRSGFFDPIIERNTVVPVSRENTYCTSAENQTVVSVEVVQGESRLVQDNIVLGEIRVDVPPRPAGEIDVNVRFTYDASGIFECEVKVLQTGEVKQLVLQGTPNSLTPAEVSERLARLSNLKIHPAAEQVNISTLARAERLFEELLGQTRRDFATHIQRFESALQSQDPARVAAERKALEAVMHSLERSDLF